MEIILDVFVLEQAGFHVKIHDPTRMLPGATRDHRTRFRLGVGGVLLDQTGANRLRGDHTSSEHSRLNPPSLRRVAHQNLEISVL